MNIFILDDDIETCASYHVDKHVVKMILESTQILSTVVRQSGIDAGYKSTHAKHPCTLWALSSLSNWRWLKKLVQCLNSEWQYRYEHTVNHKSFNVAMRLPEPNIRDIGLTRFVLCMPEKYVVNDPITSYRNYYRHDKLSIHSWKKRGTPKWIDQ